MINILTAVGLFAGLRSHAAPLCSQVLLQQGAPDPATDPVAWTRERNRELNIELQASPNKKGLEQLFYKLLSKERIVQAAGLDSSTSLKLIDRGLGKPTELVLTTVGREEVLYSNFSIKQNNSVRILNFSLSPAQDKAVLVTYARGSTDHYRLVVYDLKNRKVLKDDIPSTWGRITWKTPSSFIFRAFNREQRPQIFTYDTQTPGFGTDSLEAAYGSRAGWTLGLLYSKPVLRSLTGAVMPLDSLSIERNDAFGSIIGNDESRFFIRTRGAGNFSQVTVVDVKARSNAVTTLVPEQNVKYDYAALKSQHLILETYFGNDRRLRVYDLKGRPVADLRIPEGSQVKSADWIEPPRNGWLSKNDGRLQVVLTNPIQEAQSFVYDLKKREFESNADLQMRTRDGVEYVSEVVEAVSADGTKIPVRLTYRKGLKKDGTNPLLIEAYGGFGISHAFYGSFSATNFEFLKRGGILAGPALRGGDEFGPQWHQSAAQGYKQRTIEDLIATSNHLISNGYTSAARVIVIGASNGGMVVAAAALRSPGSFGLVIPMNGVQDMLDKEQLDPAFGPGWIYEYGDSRDPGRRALMSQIAPVTLAGLVQSSPQFLIIVGVNDSRVNPQHSYRLGAALLANPNLNPQDIQILTLKNSGHWNYSSPYQNLIGWRAQVAIWTRIFDLAGWTP